MLLANARALKTWATIPDAGKSALSKAVTEWRGFEEVYSARRDAMPVNDPDVAVVTREDAQSFIRAQNQLREAANSFIQANQTLRGMPELQANAVDAEATFNYLDKERNAAVNTAALESGRAQRFAAAAAHLLGTTAAAGQDPEGGGSNTGEDNQAGVPQGGGNEEDGGQGVANGGGQSPEGGGPQIENQGTEEQNVEPQTGQDPDNPTQNAAPPPGQGPLPPSAAANDDLGPGWVATNVAGGGVYGTATLWVKQNPLGIIVDVGVAVKTNHRSAN